MVAVTMTKKYLVASPCKKAVQNIHRIVARPLQHKPDENFCEDDEVGDGDCL